MASQPKVYLAGGLGSASQGDLAAEEEDEELACSIRPLEISQLHICPHAAGLVNIHQDDTTHDSSSRKNLKDAKRWLNFTDNK